MKNKKNLGVVSCGHKKTTESAKIILENGGNAYDAILAAHFSACVTEPVLASLGGGGFLTAHTSSGKSITYDFFTQTPHSKRQKNIDFFPISANFGSGINQEFHIGMASIATPGNIKGIFKIHKDLGSLPISEIIKPAVLLARKGVLVNKLQDYIFNVVSPIYKSNDQILSLYQSKKIKGELIKRGEIFKNSDFANFLEELAKEGDRLFYEGEVAEKILKDSKEKGGHLTKKDFKKYRVEIRKSLKFNYKNSQFITNPPPSSGGILIAFSLALSEKFKLSKNKFASFQYLKLLSEVMEKTNSARRKHLDKKLFDKEIIGKFLDPNLIKKYQREISQTINKLGGTTHMSVIDAQGNIASMTITNGEGSAYVIPKTGIVLNNMLGEEDLNPSGFGKWKKNKRISSMMAPSILLSENNINYAFGSGGSNRIRTALLQFILNSIEFKMNLDSAVQSPRIHFEKNELHIEKGFKKQEVEKLAKIYPKLKKWKEKNLFFGGVNVASFNKNSNKFKGACDKRRNGASIII